MKTFLQVMILTLVTASTFAQTTNSAKFPASIPKPLLSITPYNPVSLLKEYRQQQTNHRSNNQRWMNYALDYADLLGDDPSYAFLPLFPDTNIKGDVRNDTVFIPHYHAAATVIDPSNFLNNPWTTDYFIDSIKYSYAYLRHTDDAIVDTMVVSFFKPRINFGAGGTGVPTVYWKVVGYDPSTNQLSKYNNDTTFEIQKYKIPLTYRDSSTQTSLGVTLKTAKIAVTTPKFDQHTTMGVCIQFIPGYTYSYNDGNTLVHDLNSFYLYSSEPFGPFSVPAYNDSGNYNLSYVLTDAERYGDTLDPFRYQFYPSQGYENRFEWENHLIYFHLIEDTFNVGIKKILVANNLNFYPNPTKEIAFLGYNLEANARKVSVVIYDIAGKELWRRDETGIQAGSHKMELDTHSLLSGMYLYSFTVDGKTANGKFIVD